MSETIEKVARLLVRQRGRDPDEMIFTDAPFGQEVRIVARWEEAVGDARAMLALFEQNRPRVAVVEREGYRDVYDA